MATTPCTLVGLKWKFIVMRCQGISPKSLSHLKTWQEIITLQKFIARGGFGSLSFKNYEKNELMIFLYVFIRLIRPWTCPGNASRLESCDCIEDKSRRAGKSVFAKIRLNVTNLAVIGKYNNFICDSSFFYKYCA